MSDRNWTEDENEFDDLEPDDGEELDFDRPFGHEEEDTFEHDFEEELEEVEEEPEDLGSLTEDDLREMDLDFEAWLKEQNDAGKRSN